MPRRSAVETKTKYPPTAKLEKVGTRRQKYPQLVKSDSFFLKQQVTPKTFGQSFYLDTLRESTITLCIGPAGCGKTWLVTAVALEKLLSHQVEKIIVTKPIIEAGDEEIGFLPGDVELKILPYFQSVLECFEDHLGPTMAKKLIDDQKIIFMPTAYCRGRDIRNSFMIIDEAQNLTMRGLKLLMTRISEGTIMAINGDTDQIDLPRGKESGLEKATQALVGKNPEINVVELRNADIQRHSLISTILECLR